MRSLVKWMIGVFFAGTVFNLFYLETGTEAATTSSPITHHIVSYVKHQRKSKVKQLESPEFDFETANRRHGELPKSSNLVLHLDTSLNSTSTDRVHASATDDSPNTAQNTLESADNDIFGENEQHETSSNGAGGLGNRNKQSIPVLEPVKHLVNSVRDGNFNHTPHAHNHHHLVGDHTESPAIETEEEREMANEGNDLKFLEILGTIGSTIWTFFSNLQRVFAASSGSASAASSSSSSGGSN